MGISPFPELGTPSLSKPETEPGQENTLTCPHQAILWWLCSCPYLGWEIWRGIYYHAEEHSKFSSVSQSCPTLCDPWIAARQASLSITNTQSLLKLISITSVLPSNHLILCHPLFLLLSIFLIIRVFPVNQFFKSGGQSIGVSASASVLPMNIQDWFPLGWTGWISLQFKGFSRVFSNTKVQKHQFFSAQFSL